MSDIYVKKNFVAGLSTGVTASASTDIPNFGQIQTMVAGAVSTLEHVMAHPHVNVTLSGLQTIDGYTLLAGDRVLVSEQTTASENGIYVAAAGAWSRSADCEIGDVLKPYTNVYVIHAADGNVHELVLQANSNVTVGTDTMTWIHSRIVENDAVNIAYSVTGNTVVFASDVQGALDQVDVALEGIANMGTYTGSIIPDNQTVKNCLQALETAIETIDVSGDIATYYGGQKYKATGVTIAANTYTTITHSLNDTHPSCIEIYDMDGLKVTGAFDVDLINANSFRIKNETATVFTDMIVVVRA